MLVRLILRNASRQDHMKHACRWCSLTSQRHLTWQDDGTDLPTGIWLALGQRGTCDRNASGPRGGIPKRDDIPHFFKGQGEHIGGARTMHKDIALAGDPEHRRAFHWPLGSIQAMLPETTGEGIVRMSMQYIAGDRQRLFRRRCQREQTTKGMFLAETT